MCRQNKLDMEGGSAFDPDVDGWGDYEDVEIPL